MADVTGPLDFAFRTYTLLPESALTPVGGMSVAAVPAAASNQFTVASFNMERFFDTTDDPGGDVALTPAALQVRLAKASLAIRTALNAPDIVAVQEVENLGVLWLLSQRIDADAAAAGQQVPQYTPHLVEGNDPGGIDVGFLVKQVGGRVQVAVGRASRRRGDLHRSERRQRGPLERSTAARPARNGEGPPAVSAAARHGDRESPAIADRRGVGQQHRRPRSREAPGAGGVPGGLHPDAPEQRPERGDPLGGRLQRLQLQRRLRRQHRDDPRHARVAGSGRDRIAGSRLAGSRQPQRDWRRPPSATRSCSTATHRRWITSSRAPTSCRSLRVWRGRA